MSSGVFLDADGKQDGRLRHDVLTDFRLHEWIKEDLGYEFSSSEELSEGLDDETVYFVEKDYYHTWGNVDPEISHKVNAGPENMGRAGDFDVGKIDIPTGKITKIELKSPGRIPPIEERTRGERTYEILREGREQNEYLKRLLDNLEDSEGIEIPYSSRVKSWNDLVQKPLKIDEVPRYSEAGKYLCSPEAKKKIDQSDKIKVVNDGLFKGWMLGGGEDILENIEEVLG